MGKLLVLLGLAGAGAFLVINLPDIKRYLKIRAM
jgi:hypothetical protein